MACVSRFPTKKLRLKVKGGKERGGATGGAEVPGFSKSNDGSERRIAPNSFDRFKTLIRT
ncbi:MAG: hypothetical protein EOQ41_15610 [Mesorhizobium sp.]|uniref:hypothetical protein n=1 Tax=Mesorhizobium sp. TaxID=1871066 RepID=UPI000FEA2581|nr:hypothetical protein [Mesorhizobium sp.]RWB29912.1 MAG: hypothetical protein EOQ41_15610 [Mesorhizobium sp.]